MEKWVEVYKEYRLLYKPRCVEGKKYTAQLIIQSDKFSNATETKIQINEQPYESEDEAANVARLIGRRWVDEKLN